MHEISQGSCMGCVHTSSRLLDQMNHIIDHIIDRNLSSVKPLSGSEICTFIYSDGFSGIFKKEMDIVDVKSGINVL